MSHLLRDPQTREVVREGATEVREKLREDFSRWTRSRRYMSLKPEIDCGECIGQCKTACAGCAGTGKGRVRGEDGSVPPCALCDGHGAVTCVACSGKGRVENVHRKKWIWLMGLGGAGWLLIFFQLWGRDILPEQRAAVLDRGAHGKAVTAPVRGSRYGMSRDGGAGAPVGGQPGMQPGMGRQAPGQQGMQPGMGGPAQGGMGVQPPGGGMPYGQGGYQGGGNSMGGQAGPPQGGVGVPIRR
ncbi:MAG: hypothetical protein NT029_20080 [Armatimonadetes bacterium]|nr:hypothetical protein [Armatimonadota bacterium]